LAAHFSAPHTVPVGYLWQPPAPSQRLFVPQLAAPWSVHTLRLSTVPADSGVQVPFADVSAQLRQAPVQAVLQQTPSTQLPEAQSVGLVHAAPFVCGPQLLLTQAMPGAQSAFVVQVVLHAPAAQA
jgi:hypothetical protein